MYTTLYKSHEEDPVLCAPAARLKQDKFTCAVRVGMKVRVKIYKDCDVTPPGTFSPRLPKTNRFPEKENVNLVARKEGEMIP